MNIAKDLGNLISGLFAPQASSSVRRVEQEGTSRSRTTPREPAGSREKSTSTQASDRLTLSSESISLAYDAAELTASTVTTTTHSTADPSQRLALPYSPSTTGPPCNKPLKSRPPPVSWSGPTTAAAIRPMPARPSLPRSASTFTLNAILLITQISRSFP